MEPKSGMCAWRSLYERTAQTPVYLLSSVESAHCRVLWCARCGGSFRLASKWCGLWMSEQPSCMWFAVGPAASAAGRVVNWCLIVLAPEEWSEWHCSGTLILSCSCRQVDAGDWHGGHGRWRSMQLLSRSDRQDFQFVWIELQTVLQVPLSDVGGAWENRQPGGSVVGQGGAACRQCTDDTAHRGLWWHWPLGCSRRRTALSPGVRQLRAQWQMTSSSCVCD